MSYVVGSKFADVINGGPVGSWIGRSKSIRFGDGIPRPIELEAAARNYMQSCGLVVQAKKAGGRNMITEDGATIERRVVYALTDIDDVYDAAQAMISHVAAEHGPGRVWLTAPLSYLHRRDAEPGFVETRIQGTDNSDRDEPYSFTPTGDGTRKILLGMYYFHEATGRKQSIDDDLEQSLMDLNTSGLEQLHAIQKQVHEDIGLIGWAAEEVAEYYAKLTPAQRATCTALRQRAAAAAAAALPVGEYSAPGEPLRVKMSAQAAPPPDPLDQVIDEWMLRDLVGKDLDMQRHDDCPRQFTTAQRAAVSAHWSARLRQRVEAKRKDDEAAATGVRYCEVEPWE